MKKKNTLISRALIVCLAVGMLTSVSAPVNAKTSSAGCNQENEKRNIQCMKLLIM